MQGIVKRTIDGETYEISHMRPSKSLKILTRLFKLAGIPLGKFVSGADEEDFLKTKIKPDLIGSAVEKLAENLSEDEVHNTVWELLGEVRNGAGMEIDPEEVFEGRIFHMLKVVTAVLEHNYRDFSKGLSVVVGFAKKARTGSAGRVSTGGSTESS